MFDHFMNIQSGTVLLLIETMALNDTCSSPICSRIDPAYILVLSILYGALLRERSSNCSRVQAGERFYTQNPEAPEQSCFKT